VARSQGGVLSLQSFKEAIAEQMPTSGEGDLASASLASSGNFPARLPTLKEAEESLIAEALQRAQGNQGVAAGLLGISRQALNKRLIRRDAESF